MREADEEAFFGSNLIYSMGSFDGCLLVTGHLGRRGSLGSTGMIQDSGALVAELVVLLFLNRWRAGGHEARHDQVTPWQNGYARERGRVGLLSRPSWRHCTHRMEEKVRTCERKRAHVVFVDVVLDRNAFPRRKSRTSGGTT